MSRLYSVTSNVLAAYDGRYREDMGIGLDWFM